MKETSDCKCEGGCDVLHYYPTMSQTEYNAYKRKVQKTLDEEAERIRKQGAVS